MPPRRKPAPRNGSDAPLTRELACAVLGVPPHCAESDAKRAYRNLARAFHPDKGGDARRFQDVQRAYEHLASGWRRDADARARASESARRTVKSSGRSGGAWSARSSESTPADDGQPSETRDGTSRENVASFTAVMPGENLAELGDEALRAGDFARAVECYDAALAYARLDDYASVHRSRAVAHAGLGRWALSADDADRATRARGLWLEPRIIRAEALERLERWTAAMECYEAASEILEGRGGEGRARGEDGQDARALCAKKIAAGIARARARLAARSCVATVAAHAAAVTAVAFAPSRVTASPGDETDETEKGGRDQLLATSGADGAVSLWWIPSGERALKRLSCVDPSNGAHPIGEHPVTALAWAPREVDRRLHLAAASVTGALSLWHVARMRRDDDDAGSGTGKILLAAEVAKTFRLYGPNGGVASIAFDLESRQIAVGSDAGDVTVWSACDGNVLRAPRRRHKKAVTCVAFHPSGWQLASGSDDGDARVWDIAGMTGTDPGTCQHTLKWSRGPITRVCYTACARMICTTSATHLSKDGGEYRLLVWSAVSGRLCQWFDAHKGPVTGMSWHPDAVGARNTLVTGCEDGVVRAWSITGAPRGAGKPVHECYEFLGGGDGEEESAGRWNAHAHTVAEAKLRAWSMRQRGGPGGYAAASGSATCVRHSPGGGSVGTCHLDGKIRIVDSRTFEATSQWTLGTAARTCDWAPDEVKLVPLAKDARDGSDSDDDSDSDDSRASHSDDDDADADDDATFTTTRGARPVPHLLLVTGGDDGVVRAWRVPVNKCGEDRATWWDRERGVSDAIGPGDERREARLPSTAVAFAMAGGDKDLALTTAYQARGEDPAVAARAAEHLDELRRLYEEVEDEIDEVVERRERVVAEDFPDMTPKARRRVNQKHAEAMRPLRERRGRLYRMIKQKGFVEAEELEKEDYEEAQPPALLY